MIPTLNITRPADVAKIIDTVDDVAYLDALTKRDLDLILDDAQRSEALDAIRRALPDGELERMASVDTENQ